MPVSRRIFRSAWDLHSATGIAVGLALVVFFWGGALALYADALRQWERPAERVAYAGPVASVDALVARALDGADVRGETIRVALPTPERPALAVSWGEEAVALDPATGAVLAAQESYVGELLVQLHALAWDPYSLGMGLAGWIGLVAIVNMLTGLVIHLKSARRGGLLRVRPAVRGRALWADAHRVVGTLVLPFGVALAFTGALIGIGHVYYFAVTPVALGGDPEGYIGDLGPELTAVATAVGAPVPLRIDPTLGEARATWPDADAEEVIIEGAGEAGSVVTVRVREREALVGGAGDVGHGLLAVDAATGEARARVSPSRPYNAGAALWQAMLGVHYGTYGGPLLKALYFALALAFCATVVTGQAMWLAARRRRHPERTVFYDRLGRLTAGVAAGLVPATAALFLANKLVPMDLAGRTTWEGAAFYGAWALAVGAALAAPTPVLAGRRLLVAGAALCALVPLANGLVTGAWPWTSSASGWDAVFWTDIGFLLAAPLLLLSARQLSAEAAPPASEPRPLSLSPTRTVQTDG